MNSVVARLTRYWKAIAGAAAGLLALLVTVPTDLLDPKLAAWVSVAVAVLGVIAGPANAPSASSSGDTGPQTSSTSGARLSSSAKH